MAGPVLVLIGKVSLVLAAAIAAAWASRHADARARHQLWSGVFAAVLLLPLVALVVPALPVPVPSWMTRADAPAPRISSHTMRADDPPRPAQAVEVPTDAPAAATELSRAVEARTAPAIVPSITAVLAGIWIAGAIAALLSLGAALWRVRRLSRLAVPLDDPAWRASALQLRARLGCRGSVRLLVSAEVATPMAGGILAPTIYLPATAAGWSAEHREVVLAHEIAHLAGRDPLRQVLTRAAVAAYWFHPLVWFAARQSAVAREQACDQTVLALGTRPSTYARVLLDFADAPRGSVIGLAALPMVQRSHLEKRLMAILNETTRPCARHLALVPAALAALTLAVAAAQPAASAATVTQGAAAVPGAIGGIAGGVAHRVAAGVPGGVPGGVVGGLPEGVPGGVEGAVPPGVSAGTLAGVPAGVTGRVAPMPQGSRSACEWNATGSFTGTMNTTSRGQIVDRVGTSGHDLLIQRTFGDMRVCALVESLPANAAVRPSQWASAARRVVLETQDGRETRRMEIEGARLAWFVNGQARPVDAAAAEWRDRMTALIEPLWQLSQLRGEVSSLRGQISSIHGQRSSLRGEISSLRGQVSSMRGEISSWRGQESSLRGQISAIQGHLSSLRGRISSERGAISSLEASRWNATDAERARIAQRVSEHEKQIKQIEAEIAKYDVDGKVRDVEKRLEQLDVEEKIAEVERRLRGFDVEQRVQEVEKQIAQLEVERRVAEIEREMSALDLDRRAPALEAQIDAALRRLRELR